MTRIMQAASTTRCCTSCCTSSRWSTFSAWETCVADQLNALPASRAVRLHIQSCRGGVAHMCRYSHPTAAMPLFVTLQISDVDGALVRTFLSPAHMRAASLVSLSTVDLHTCTEQTSEHAWSVINTTAAESFGWILSSCEAEGLAQAPRTPELVAKWHPRLWGSAETQCSVWRRSGAGCGKLACSRGRTQLGTYTAV